MVPGGLDPAGLPTAVQLGGPPRSEQLLLSVVGEIERACGWADRRPPEPDHIPEPGGRQ
jgi:amidase